MFFLRSQRASWHLFWCPNVMLCWEPNGFPDICFWCPRLMCFFYSPDICFWCTKLLYRLFESPASFLTFVLAPKTHVFDHSEFPDICCWCPKLMFFWEPRRFPDICFGAQNWCIVSKSPAGFLTFVFWFQNSCFLRARRVSWPLFLVPKTHVFWEPGRFPDICFGAQISCFVESPVCFLTLVLGAQDSCFFDSPDICFWCTKLLYRLFESPASFLTFVFGAQNTCVFLRCQRVSWHLLLVSKTHVFGEPRRFPDICFGAQNSCKKSPAGFLIFVFRLKNSAFWEVPKTHVFWKLSEFAECPRYIILESPEGSLTFVLETQISCFFESPMGFLTFVFGAQDSCFFFWQPRHLLLVHKTLVQVVWEPGEFPDICFWRPKHMFFFWDPSEFPDICCWCTKLMFLESPEGFLTFVLVPKIHVLFERARRVYWPLFLVPKTHAVLQPRRFRDICFWCPKLMLFWEPSGFPDICLVPKTHVFFFDSPDICFWCTKLLYRLFESPASFLTFVFGAQNTCFLFEIPASFLTFVVGVQNSCFWRAQKVSWHLFWYPKFMYFLKEPGGFPDICFWFQNSCFLRGAQNSCFLKAQRISWMPKIHNSGEPRSFPDICFGTPKLMFFWEPNGFPDICFWCPRLMFFLPAPTFAFGAQNSCTGCLRARRVSWHLFLAPKTHVFFWDRRFANTSVHHGPREVWKGQKGSKTIQTAHWTDFQLDGFPRLGSGLENLGLAGGPCETRKLKSSLEKD